MRLVRIHISKNFTINFVKWCLRFIKVWPKQDPPFAHLFKLNKFHESYVIIFRYYQVHKCLSLDNLFYLSLFMFVIQLTLLPCVYLIYRFCIYAYLLIFFLFLFCSSFRFLFSFFFFILVLTFVFFAFL